MVWITCVASHRFLELRARAGSSLGTTLTRRTPPRVAQIREKTGAAQGSGISAPNPRGMNLERFATAEQKLIAQYNIACCYAAMGDTPRTMEILSAYVGQVCRGRGPRCVRRRRQPLATALGLFPPASHAERPLTLLQVGEPLNQINEMLVDEDLISVRHRPPARPRHHGRHP